MNKKILRHIIRYILMILIVLVCIKIFILSSQNGDSSSNLSNETTRKIINVFERNITEADLAKKVQVWDPFIRKLAHCYLYALLGLLFMGMMETYDTTTVKKLIFSFFFTFIYSWTDEFHQMLIPGRSGRVSDVLIDSIGIIIGILLMCLIMAIIKQIKKKRKQDENEKTNAKILFIASTGGHLNELLQLKPLFSQYEYQIITENTEVDKSIKEEYGNKMKFLIYGTKRYPIRYIFKFIANCFISLVYYMKFGPDVIVTTGTHTAVPMCYIGKLFGRKIIYIETFANRTTGTLAGKIVYPIADTFVIQWEELKSVYPKSEYWGWIY